MLGSSVYEARIFWSLLHWLWPFFCLMCQSPTTLRKCNTKSLDWPFNSVKINSNIWNMEGGVDEGVLQPIWRGCVGVHQAKRPQLLLYNIEFVITLVQPTSFLQTPALHVQGLVSTKWCHAAAKPNPWASLVPGQLPLQHGVSAWGGGGVDLGISCRTVFLLCFLSVLACLRYELLWNVCVL